MTDISNWCGKRIEKGGIVVSEYCNKYGYPAQIAYEGDLVYKFPGYNLFARIEKEFIEECFTENSVEEPGENYEF